MRAEDFIQLSDIIIKRESTLYETLYFYLLTDFHECSFTKDLESRFCFYQQGLSSVCFYENGRELSCVSVGLLTSGQFVVKKKICLDEEDQYEAFEYFSPNGRFLYALDKLEGSLLSYNTIQFETLHPFTNFLYNVLNLEYQKTRFGSSDTKKIAVVEESLAKLKADPKITLGINLGIKDPALERLKTQTLELEKDPVLNWTERQEIGRGFRQTRAVITSVKKRAHNLKPLKYGPLLFIRDLKTLFGKFKLRPFNNLYGVLYKYTIGKIIWLLQTAKNNLGLSLAMAIYTPFTFYFISQPMNPHAMWVVGKVRGAFIATVETVEQALGLEQTIDEMPMVSDQVNTLQASVEENIEEAWVNRMTKFKAMQIAYEADMIAASRFGRMEQVDSTFLFPLTVESAWKEALRYEKSLKTKLNLKQTPKHRVYLDQELSSTKKFKAYLYDKMKQFYTDYIYIIVDMDNEHDYKDYYFQRGFSLFKEIVQELNIEDDDSINKKLIALSNQNESQYMQADSVENRMRLNSSLFRMKDSLDTDLVRSKLKRQWEILYLQQQKMQESAHFALKQYTDSVRHAIWLFQSVLSTKNSELDLLLSGKMDPKEYSKNSKFYESTLHMMVIEFASVRKEIESALPNDTEVKRRIALIKDLRNGLEGRDRLSNNGKTKAQVGAR